MSIPETAEGRLEYLKQIQDRVQKKWSTTKPFQVNAPTDPEERKKRNKFLVTFPYPYMNGRLHLGHAFTVAKAEFAVRYQRLLGKKALFPFGFHCTGMPILACAQRLQAEIKEREEGIVAEVEEEKEEEAAAAVVIPTPEVIETTPIEGEEAVVVVAPKKKNKKGKLAAKSTGLKSQWEIMRSMDVPEEEIHEFANTQKWLDYWPPIARNDLNRLGMAIDWRRTFVTTDVNPYYDAFIKWQFNQLNKKGKIGFGQMMCVYSTASEANCADHDRTEGEGVTAQEYTLVKLELQKPYPQELIQLFASHKTEKDNKFDADSMTVYLPAATLRPETMYGQTNAFLKPDGEYAVYIMNDKEIFICSQHSANNMAYQYIFGEYQGKTFDTPKVQLDERLVGTIEGEKFFGKKVNAPLTPYKSVYLFPLTTILMDKGTGVVTSVPSDAPTDYATFMEIKQYKREYYAKTYGITDDMVKDYEVIDIININDENSGINTNCIAKLLCEREKVTTHKDVKLPLLKDEAYRLGFDRGVMIVGEYKGQPIKEVKELSKKDLIKAGIALAYSEPESRVVSRLGDVCVCALLDQWFLKYGEESWQKQIHDHVANDNTFNSYNAQIKNKLIATIAWLQRWGCSRAFGLGTRLPFDDNFLIESLSDSTIYMAYYTIVQILQGGTLTGTQPNDEERDQGMVSPAVSIDDLNDDLFDYIFFEGEYDASKVKVSQELCDSMRREFEFWYPHDLRVSGKDLLQNHLVMSLYNHAAIWDARTDRMPGGYYANGLLMINNQKMSKSTGNFLTLDQAIDKYGSDAVRFGLAAAGDSLEDANFTHDTAQNSIAKLTLASGVFEEHYIKYIKEGKYRTGELQFWDRVALKRFQSALDRIKFAYDSMLMIDVIRQFHILFAIRDEYRIAITPDGAIVTRQDYVDTNFHELVAITFMRILSIIISPIIPHWTQDLHEKLIQSGLLDKVNDILPHDGPVPELVIDEQWPTIVLPENTTAGNDDNILDVAKYLLAMSDTTRAQYSTFVKLQEKRRKGDTVVVPPNHLTVCLATGYQDWQQKVIQTCRDHAEKFGEDAFGSQGNALKTIISGLFEDKKIKTNAMKFLVELTQDYKNSQCDNHADKVNDVFSLSTPFNEVALWTEYSQFLIRAVGSISGANPATFKILPVDPANPIDDQGKPLALVPRPAKPVFLFVSQE